MIRKILAVTSLAVVGLLSAPGTAQAYTAPDQPELVLQMDPDDIVLGVTDVPFESRDWLPGSDARFSVSAPGVSGSDIALTMWSDGARTGATASGGIDAVVASDTTFTVGAVFPEAAVYTISTEGFDLDGNARTVSMRLPLGQGTGGDGGGGTSDGGGGGGGGGLPGTGFSSFSALLAGAGLAGIGAGVILLSRRSAGSPRDAVNING